MVTCSRACPACSARSGQQNANKSRAGSAQAVKGAAEASWGREAISARIRQGGPYRSASVSASEGGGGGSRAQHAHPGCSRRLPHLLLLPDAVAAGHGLQVVLRVPVCDAKRGRAGLEHAQRCMWCSSLLFVARQLINKPIASPSCTAKGKVVVKSPTEMAYFKLFSRETGVANHEHGGSALCSSVRSLPHNPASKEWSQAKPPNTHPSPSLSTHPNHR